MITMITIHTSINLPDGRVRRRYLIEVDNLKGEKCSEIIGIFNHSSSDDGSEVEKTWLDNKKQQEIDLYKEEIRAGRNPFKLYQSSWLNRYQLLKHILDDALTLPATDPLVYNGIKFLELTSDDELKSLYGKGQTWVDDVRIKAAELLSAKNKLDNYNGVL